MGKDIIISALAADAFIFMLFLDGLAGWRQKKERVREMERLMGKLRRLEISEAQIPGFARERGMGQAVFKSLMRSMELQRAEDVKQIIVMLDKAAGRGRNILS